MAELVRDKQKTMPALDPAIDALRIWHCGYKTLQPLAALHGLRTLVVATFPSPTRPSKCWQRSATSSTSASCTFPG
jgi:hypothetical protein